MFGVEIVAGNPPSGNTCEGAELLVVVTGLGNTGAEVPGELLVESGATFGGVLFGFSISGRTITGLGLISGKIGFGGGATTVSVGGVVTAVTGAIGLARNGVGGGGGPLLCAGAEFDQQTPMADSVEHENASVNARLSLVRMTPPHPTAAHSPEHEPRHYIGKITW